mmetsp:Transcript_1029/g.2024  ORF Transcript_1029/g.2024 Transcript_1029/m.2024 type:complete len:1026 (+) Transcript_1029:83-3160(+)
MSSEGGGEEVEESHAVLFPWMAELLGVLCMFVITRFAEGVPYTAALFVLGTVAGALTSLLEGHDVFTESVNIWLGIDSEVLLLVFLPGLIFGDALFANFHLFMGSLKQLLVFAFPMVLAGTGLTALCAFYVLPFEWSFFLCLTIGSILAATDPVAVSALLNEVGSPPRLRIHISGESMLNDGSAIVFFSIFSKMFLAELEIEGVGDTFTVGQGFALFFQMSLGGMAIGVAFGAGLILVLYALNRKLSKEDTVLQVSATITFAYLTYFVAEVVAGTSGVIATVFCGITTNAFGGTLIHHEEYLQHVWHTIEYLLNSLLFVLGGVVFGASLQTSAGETRYFAHTDWGYLILMFLFIVLIRFLLFFAAYPLISRIGLKTNVRETIFSCWAGLRGAVGIALALSLDSDVVKHTEPGNPYRKQSAQLFVVVGGVAFITLVLNGSTSAKVLKTLGLTDSSPVRIEVVQCLEHRIKLHILDDFIHLLSTENAEHARFSVIRSHVSILEDITMEDLILAVRRNKEETPETIYEPPNLESIIRELGGTPEQKKLLQNIIHGPSHMNLHRGGNSPYFSKSTLSSPEEESKRQDDFREQFHTDSRTARSPQTATSQQGTSPVHLGVNNDKFGNTHALANGDCSQRNSASTSALPDVSNPGQAAGIADGDNVQQDMPDSLRVRVASNVADGEEEDPNSFPTGQSCPLPQSSADANDQRDSSLSLGNVHAPVHSSEPMMSRRGINYPIVRNSSARLASRNRLQRAHRSSMDRAIGVAVHHRQSRAIAHAAETLETTNLVSARVMELREVFISLLLYAYKDQINRGELGRRGVVDYALLQSLEFASDNVNDGNKLNDWYHATELGTSSVSFVQGWLAAWTHKDFDSFTRDGRRYRKQRHMAYLAFSFIKAHRSARAQFKTQFADSLDELSKAEEVVLNESLDEVRKAQEVLNGYPEERIRIMISHNVSQMLLNKQARHIEKLEKEGLLKEREASVIYGHVTEQIRSVARCDGKHQPSKAKSQSTSPDDGSPAANVVDKV